MGTTNIDSAWLTANGPAPYVIQDSNETYQLQQNVTTDGPAFVIKDSATVTLDLNGFTLTYDNTFESGLTLTNWDFSSGDSTGWDFTNTDGQTQVLTGGHTGTANGSLRAPNPGAYSVIWDVVGGSATQYIESNSTVTLTANETYFLGFWHNDQGFSQAGGWFKVTMAIQGTAISFSYGSGGTIGSSRAGQVVGAYFRPTSNTTGKVRVTVQKINSPSGNICTGMLFVRGALRHGVCCPTAASTTSSPSWGKTPYAGSASDSTNISIVNGTIIQGAGRSIMSSCIHNEAKTQSWCTDVTARTNGYVDSVAYFGRWGNKHTISGCTFEGDAATAFITDRDNRRGFVCWLAGGDCWGTTITNSTIRYGVQGGLWFKGGNDSDPVIINGLTIEKLHTKYVNGFAAAFGGQDVGSEFKNSLIDTWQGGDTQYGSRGIHIDGAHFLTIDNVTCNVKDKDDYQEGQYDGWCLQLEESCRNNTIKNSTFTVHSLETNGAALRLNFKPSFSQTATNVVQNCTFKAIAEDFQYWAACATVSGNTNMSNPNNVFKFDAAAPSTMITNSLWLQVINTTSNWNWEGITFITQTPRDNNPLPQAPETAIGFVIPTLLGGNSAISNFNILDPVFPATATRDEFDIMRWHLQRESGSVSTEANTPVRFTTVFDSGVASELVEVKNANTSTVRYSGTTNGSNQVSLTIDRVTPTNGIGVKQVYDVYAGGALRLEDWTPTEKTSTAAPIDISGATIQTIDFGQQTATGTVSATEWIVASSQVVSFGLQTATGSVSNTGWIVASAPVISFGQHTAVGSIKEPVLVGKSELTDGKLWLTARGLMQLRK